MGGTRDSFHLPLLGPFLPTFPEVLIDLEFIYLGKQIWQILVSFKIVFIFVTFFPPWNSAGTCILPQTAKTTKRLKRASTSPSVSFPQIRLRVLKQSFQPQNTSAERRQCVQAISVFQLHPSTSPGKPGFSFSQGFERCLLLRGIPVETRRVGKKSWVNFPHFPQCVEMLRS